MIEIVLVAILFIIGIYFGSFFTLATYRLPKHENITYKHSYCPNCNHKLGLFDLIPIFSYIGLKGKCRYCKQPIRIRYFLFEILTGITFVLWGISLKINIYSIQIQKLIYLMLGVLYLASLFIIGGINKEKNTIQKSVLFYGVIVSIIHIIYSCTFDASNVYKYAIYLFMMIVLLILETASFKNNLKENDKLKYLILVLYMLIFTGEYITISTLICTILIMGIRNIIISITSKKSQKVTSKEKVKPISFYTCVSNIIILIGTNYIINYMIK